MKPCIDHLGLILLNWCLVEYRVVCLVTRVHLPSKSPMKIIIPLDCKNREKIKVSNPQYMGYNPYKWRLWVQSAFRHLHNKNQRKLFNAMLTLDLYPPRVETMFHLKMGQRHPGMARRWSELGNHLNHHFLPALKTNSKLAHENCAKPKQKRIVFQSSSFRCFCSWFKGG